MSTFRICLADPAVIVEMHRHASERGVQLPLSKATLGALSGLAKGTLDPSPPLDIALAALGGSAVRTFAPGGQS